MAIMSLSFIVSIVGIFCNCITGLLPTQYVGNLVAPMCEELISMQLLIILVERYFDMCIIIIAILILYMYYYDIHFYHYLCIIIILIIINWVINEFSKFYDSLYMH